jgi:hypothetical protein
VNQHPPVASTAGEARAAKARLRQRLAGDRRVNGVGLTRVDGGWALSVNVVDAGDAPELPGSVDGVPVRVRVVGQITAHAS